MCGRYFITLAMDKKFKQRIKQHKRQSDPINRNNITGNEDDAILDIFPGEEAFVIDQNKNLTIMKWGFKSKCNSLLINARAESAEEKPTFKDHLKNERIVIPAAGFYEWDRHKNKNTFKTKDHSPLFFAGFSRTEEDGPHFIIMTRSANSSMLPVHDRMPLILSKSEIDAWLDKNTSIQESSYIKLLSSEMPELDRENSQQQTALF